MSDSSDDLYRAVFEASPDGVLVVGEEGTVRHVNPAAEELFGYTRAEMVGEPVEMLVPEQHRTGHVRHRERYHEHPRQRPMGIGLELRGLRKDGSEVPVEISLSPLTAGDEELVIATVRDVTQRNRLRDFGAGALRASEEERQRIARELHDDTAQYIATLLVRLRLVEQAGADGEWRERLADVREHLYECAESVRRIARGLRPPELEDAGLPAAVRSHMRAVSDETGLDIEVEVGALVSELDAERKLVLYRILQEAVSNVVRHAGADRIDVDLREEAGTVELVVRDDGRGFDPARTARVEGGGLGLLGMHERAVSVGGHFSVESEEGKGTRVRATIPAAGGGIAAPTDRPEVEHV